jgi:hypothetical protein
VHWGVRADHPLRWLPVLVALVLIAILGVAIVRGGIGGTRFALSSATPGPRMTEPPGAVVLVGAGDIADCGEDADEATARLLDVIDGTVFAAGDNAYENGSLEDYQRCYAPTWGRHLDRTLPAIGNHEWQTPGAAGYHEYFGARAGGPGTGWYATTLGEWRLIVLDSDCGDAGGCTPDSAQGRWLADELATNPAPCTVAIWHHPRFSSGRHGDDAAVDPFWRAMYDAGADLVVNGHEHSYERFAPQDADGRGDPERGIQEIVVGTGGKDLRSFDRPVPNSEIREAGTYGVLRLVLRPDGFDWRFLPVAGQTFTDAGSGTCH